MLSKPLALLAFFLMPALGLAEESGRPTGLDWSTWQHLPVFHDGRMMPLNTFARMAVDKITGRPNPRLAPPESSASSGKVASRDLFPDGKPRSFDASELLFSWLVEPDRWDDVPFLKAGHETLRSEILGLPTRDAQGNHLKFASPADVRSHLTAIRMRLADMSMKQRQGEEKGTKYRPDDLENRLGELFDAYTLFNLLTFNPEAASDHMRYRQRLGNLVDIWNNAGGDIHWISEANPDRQVSQLATATEDSLQKLLELDKENNSSLAKIEPLVVKLHESSAALAKQFAEYDRRFSEKPPEASSEDRLKQARTRVHALASQISEMARESNEAHIALYDNGQSLRLVPALNPAALEQNRDANNDAQPWLSLSALRKGSEQVLAGYPKEDVARVRKAFDQTTAAYVGRNDPQRAARFRGAMDELAASVRALGQHLEPLRRQLPIEKRDEVLLAATAYPAPNATWAEVHYYEFSPFFWSWLASLGAMTCFALSFGIVRKPLFWLGMAVVAAALLLTIYGFGLRVYITRWAPVTNMFETVMFVALVVSFLGAVFTMAPVLGPGLRNAWRLTAIPATWEAHRLSHEQLRLLHERSWTMLGAIFLVPRAIMAALVFQWLVLTPYGAGKGYTVVSLWPRTAVGTSMPTMNDVTVWLVGMTLLAVAMWYLPRAILAAVIGLATVPATLAIEGLQRSLDHAVARKPFAFAGASVGLLVGLVANYAPVLDKNINPLMPVLRDNFWLTLHVLTITASYGAGALAWGLGNAALAYYLFGKYRDPLPQAAPEGHRPAGQAAAHASLMRRPPEACASLATFTYKAMQVAVLLLAAGTILGGLWADVSWGRFWGWDSKEVWALVSLLIYLAVLHGRYAGWFGNFGLAVGSVVGAISIVMAWYGVNFWLGSGLHSYGEGAGGGLYVFGAAGLNLLLTIPPAIRYVMETGSTATTQPTVLAEAVNLQNNQAVETP